jgi:hypothetical protein
MYLATPMTGHDLMRQGLLVKILKFEEISIFIIPGPVKHVFFHRHTHRRFFLRSHPVSLLKKHLPFLEALIFALVSSEHTFPFLEALIFALVSSEHAFPFLEALIFIRCSSEKNTFPFLEALMAALVLSEHAFPFLEALIFALVSLDAAPPPVPPA